MWPISATQWIFGDEPLDATCPRLADFGYNGIELSGEPDLYPPAAIERAVELAGLEVTSICGMYTPARDLSHPDRRIRSDAIEYVTACGEMAASTGANVVIVVPTAVGRVQPLLDADSEWGMAVDSLQQVCARTEQLGVCLVIEALNRYESYLVNTLGRASQLVAETGCVNLGIMADLFHMNLEERSVEGALEENIGHVKHVHLADSNRRPPGQGHTDFASILRVLGAGGYAGAMTMEFLPPTSNPYLTASLDVDEGTKSRDCKRGIEYIRALL